MKRGGGRPRDPELASRVQTASVDLLAEVGYYAVTADGLAARAGVGKASIYRRWRTLDAVLADAVRELGPAAAETGSLRGDLAALLDRCRHGVHAHAELSVLSVLRYRPLIAQAWAEGPEARLSRALGEIARRAVLAGETWPGDTRVRAAVALVRHEAMRPRERSSDALVVDVLDRLLTAPAVAA